MILGSLCSGYGGLDLAVHDTCTAGDLAWVAEVDPHACTVLDARFGVPNLGDLTTVDWGEVERVDVLTAGYPCQPFSHAGIRKGTDDVRHLWPYIRDAVSVLRPGRVVLENVAGHLSLGAGDVLADLAGLGYRFAWGVVRASDAGACHRRARWFCVADSEDIGYERPGVARGTPASHADSTGLEGRRRTQRGRADERATGAHSVTAWGNYEPAIRHHELTLGRPAPAPTDDRGRLSPRFVEWMMMLPDGWVCDLIESRTAALRMLGNGVVPAQAALALRTLERALAEGVAA